MVEQKQIENAGLWTMWYSGSIFGVNVNGKEDRLNLVQARGIFHYEFIMKIWDKYRKWVEPHQSPAMSFMYHPMFQVAAQCSNFSHWERSNMDHCLQGC